MLIIIDKRADAAQHKALRTILYGEETDPGSTAWNVFRSMIPTVHEPSFTDIRFDGDIEARQADVQVPNLVEMKGEPIRNPVTGAEHRARIIGARARSVRFAWVLTMAHFAWRVVGF